MLFNDRRKKKPTAPTPVRKGAVSSRDEVRALETRSLRAAHERMVQGDKDKAAAKRAGEERARDASMVKPITEPERAHWARGTRRYSTPGRFEFNE